MKTMIALLVFSVQMYLIFARPGRPCDLARSNSRTGMIGDFVPDCKPDGSYEGKQCWGSTGECWCVDGQTGEELKGTRMGPDRARGPRGARGEVKCGRNIGRPCDLARSNSRTGMIGAFVPDCKPDGSYEERQCWGSTGECWCVDGQTGEELKGTRMGPGRGPGGGEVNCGATVFSNPMKEEQDPGLLEGASRAVGHVGTAGAVLGGVDLGGVAVTHGGVPGGYRPPFDNLFYDVEDTKEDGMMEKRMLKHTINYNPTISKTCSASRCDGTKCGCKTGHNKGSCWTRCTVFGVLVGHKEWCYTNGKFDQSQNMELVKCKKHSDCCPDWSCGGACTV